MSGAKVHDGGGNPGAPGQRDRSPHPSTLPPEVAGFIEQVVRGTRLRKAERNDVRAELSSHFAEALASGASAAAAMASYGDPKESARALRAAAIAKRSPIDRALGRALVATGWTVGVVVGCYVLFGLYLAITPPRLGFDPIKRLGERLPAAASGKDSAWVRYRSILPALGLTEHVDASNQETDRIDAGPGWVGRDPDTEEGATWDQQVAWCDAHAAPLKLLRETAAVPVFGFPYVDGLSDADGTVFTEGTIASSRRLIDDTTQLFRAFGVMLPHLANMRQSARVLALDATVQASRGHGGAAVDDLAAIIAMSMQVQQPRFLICDLVAVAMRSVAVQRATMLLESMPDAFTDADLARLQAAMRSVPAELAMLDLWGERIAFEDAVQCMYSDDGNGDGYFNPTARGFSLLQRIDAGGYAGSSDVPAGQRFVVIAAGPAAALWVAGRKDLMDFHDAWSEELLARKAWTLRELQDAPPTTTDAPLRSGDWVTTSRYLMAALLLPAIDRANMTFAADRAQREAVDVAAACVRYRIAHGAWPHDGAQLVPAFLPAEPMDPWSGKPIAMAGEGKEFRVWSVGDDLIDHDGRIGGPGASPNASTKPRSRSGGGALADPAACDWVWFAPTGSVDRWFED